MQSLERTITVTTPLPQVWDYLTDFVNTESWDPPTQSCVCEVAAGEDDRGVGTVYTNVSSVLGRDTEITYTVAEYQPRRRFQVRGETSRMKLLDTITFEGDETGTTLTYRAEFHPEGAAKLVEPLLPLGLKRLGDSSADQLEEMLLALPHTTR